MISIIDTPCINPKAVGPHHSGFLVPVKKADFSLRLRFAGFHAVGQRAEHGNDK